MRAKTSEAGTFEGTCTAIYALSQADSTFSEIMEGLKPPRSVGKACAEQNLYWQHVCSRQGFGT